MNESGENLWRAVKCTASAWDQIYALNLELERILKKEIEDGLAVTLATGKEFDEWNQSGDVCLKYSYQYGLQRRRPGRPVPFGWLFIQEVLGEGPGGKSLVREIPYVVVGYAMGADQWDNDPLMWLADDRDGYLQDLELGADGKVFCGKGERSQRDAEYTEWYFAMPLFSLESTEALKSLIVTPVIRLLSGETFDDVLSHHPSAFVFETTEDGFFRRRL